MSTLAQTYLLASKVKQKLTKEAVNPNANLRVLVCQANLLDNLMDSLQHKKPLPNFPSVSISSIKIDEELEDEEEYSSSSDNDDYSDDEEDEWDDYEDYTIGEEGAVILEGHRTRLQRGVLTNVRTMELSGEDDDEYFSDEFTDSASDSDLEDYDVNYYTHDVAANTTAIYSDSSVSSDDEVEIEDFGQDLADTPPSSPEDTDLVFTSLAKLDSNYFQRQYHHHTPENYKLVSIDSLELPSLSHCSSISSEEDDEVDESHKNHHSHHSHGVTFNLHHKTESEVDLLEEVVPPFVV